MSYVLILEILLYLTAGCLTGILSALFGMGGGLIIVPTLYWLFTFQGMNSAFVMHLAVGTSLAVMIVTVINSAWTHHQKGNVIWPLVRLMILPMALAVFLGTISSRYIYSVDLRYLFIVFLVYTVLAAVFKKDFTARYVRKDFIMPNRCKAVTLAFMTGFISVLLGIGGSVVTVPFFRKARMPMQNAAACAAALSPVIALVGTLGYIIVGWRMPALPHDSLGFVYLPAFFGIALGTFAGVPSGARLARRIPDHLLAKIYVGMLILIVLSMVV